MLWENGKVGWKLHFLRTQLVSSPSEALSRFRRCTGTEPPVTFLHSIDNMSLGKQGSWLNPRVNVNTAWHKDILPPYKISTISIYFIWNLFWKAILTCIRKAWVALKEKRLNLVLKLQRERQRSDREMSWCVKAFHPPSHRCTTYNTSSFTVTTVTAVTTTRAVTMWTRPSSPRPRPPRLLSSLVMTVRLPCGQNRRYNCLFS